MTPGYNQLWRKWRFYKKLLIGFFVLNVFCVASGFVLSFNYWGFKQSLRNEHHNGLTQLAASAELERQVAELEPQLLLPVKNDRSAVFREAKEWQKLQEHLTAAGLSNKFPLSENIMADPKAALNYLKEIKQSLAQERKVAYTELSKMVESYSNTTWELISIGVFTLLFGLIIPAFIIWQITKLLKRTTDELRASAREIVREWTAQHEKFGAEAFKNMEFWVQIGLLATQITGRSANHPMIQLTGELANLIRQELEKSRATE